MCQNIKTFLTGVERCTSSDVVKSESCLSNINSALNTASNIRASIDSKLKELFQLSADYAQGRIASLGKLVAGITEHRRGSGGMLPRQILKISLSENVFPGF